MARKAKLLPDVEELKKMVYLDSSITNGLRWKIKPTKNIVKDNPAGCLVGYEGHQYFSTGINGKLYYNHRIIYSIYHNINLTSEQIVDHRDRCPQNNNPNNLRIVTATENQRNQTKQKNTSSKYKGVYFNKQAKKFRAQIRVNKIAINLGLFSTEQEAAKAYNCYIISHNLSHFNLNQI